MNITIIICLSITFIFTMTTLGSSLVFAFKKIKMQNKYNAIILGFASGIMISASVFSLILPALEFEILNLPNTFIVALGIVLGGMFLSVLDFIKLKQQNNTKKIKHALKMRKNAHKHFKKIDKSIKLFIAVTLHNIPEGLAVGLAFGLALHLAEPNTIISAIMLSIGIGVQNFPEGIAVAFPIKLKTNNAKLGFMYGTMSGIVEPMFACIGLLLSNILLALMPLLLSFSAGAMIFVVVCDLITDKSFVKNQTLGAWSFIIGFLTMMTLDLCLG